MPSLRAQILAAAEAKLETVRAQLDWTSLLRNPREPVGQDQFDALVMFDGGDRAPSGLTGHVEERWVEFSVGLMVLHTNENTAEDRLDAALTAVADTLIDPADIQLGGLAIDIQLGAISDPVFGRSEEGARAIGGQSLEFMVRYLATEGNFSQVAP